MFFQTGLEQCLCNHDKRVLYGFLGLAQLAVNQHDYAQAFVLLRDAERLMQQRHIPDTVYRSVLLQVSSHFWLQQGRAELVCEALSRVLKHYRGPQARQAPPATLELIPRIEYLLIIARFRTEPDTSEAAVQLESLMKQAQTQGMWLLATELQLALAEVLWLEGQATKAIDILQEGLRNVTRYQAHQVLNELRQRQPLLFGDGQASPGTCHQPCSRSDTAQTLSQRELQVLKLVALGHSNQEIADTLFISLHTVKTHTRRIHGKLRVERRTQAVAKAKALGLWG